MSLQGTARFVHGMRKLLVVYGVIVSSHFLVGLIVLCVLYTKVLKWIRNLKNSYSMYMESCMALMFQVQRLAAIIKGFR